MYETADGWIAIAALQPPQWLAVAEAVDLEHLTEDPRFATFDDVIRNRDQFRVIFGDQLRTMPTDHWWQRLRAAGIWVAPVNRLEDLATDQHIRANDYLVDFDDGFTGPPTPYDVDGWPGSRGSAADYAQHTDDVLGELGYDDHQILQLKAEGAVW